MKSTTIAEAFNELVSNDEPIEGLQSLLRSTFISGAFAALNLLEKNSAKPKDELTTLTATEGKEHENESKSI